MSDFNKVQDYLLNLGYEIKGTDEEEEIFIVSDEENGLSNVIIDCEFPLLIVEMHVVDLKGDDDLSFYRTLLEKNRTCVHGAFVIDSEKDKVLFRDTLELENLDENELEGTLNAFKLAIGENFNLFLDYIK